MTERIALLDLAYSEVADLLRSWGEPRFRAEQVWRWIYRSQVPAFSEMANLPLALRTRLEAETVLELLTPLAESRSQSGDTRKILFELRDGQTIETVLMAYRERQTLCISTQIGCAMGCTFCATGQGGLVRNLSTGEILDQVLHVARQLRLASIKHAETVGTHQAAAGTHPISNVVFMGMGEPMANFAATWQAIQTLVDGRGYGLGARRITLSTVGLVPGIQRLSQAGLPVNLAVSLHAADDDLRNRLVPMNARYPLPVLMQAIRDYVHCTGRRVTIEYALIAGINDALDQAAQLARLLAGLPCHVNLIPLNPTPGSALLPASRERARAFSDTLERHRIPATIRLARGMDIDAGCGQLRQRQQSENLN